MEHEDHLKQYLLEKMDSTFPGTSAISFLSWIKTAILSSQKSREQEKKKSVLSYSERISLIGN